MKKIRLLSIALILSLFVLVFYVSCPHGDEAVKGTAKLVTPQTVEGAKNVEVYSTRFTIQLSDGAKFLKLGSGLDVKSWFNPQVPGLLYRVERDVNEGADTINIVVEGTPTEMSSSPIVIIVPYQMVSKDENGKEVVTPIIKNGTQNITVGDQKEGSKSLETQSRYAIGETPDKPIAVLDTSLVISGQQGLPFTSSYSATIKLTTGRFASLEAGKDVHTWFEPNYYPDLTYTLTNAVRKNTKTADITISGTPKEEARGALKITIPADCLIEKIETPVQIGAGNSASYNITNAAASAEFTSKVDIVGTSNVVLANKTTFTIALTGATFKAMAKGYDISNDSSWLITPKIDGLTYTTVNALENDLQNQLTIEVAGTPKLGSESVLNITIPKSAVVLPKDRENEVKEIVVDTKGSTLNIKGPKADLVGESFTLDGRQGIAIVDKEFTVKLTDVTFKKITAESVKNEVKNWFGQAVVEGLTYSLKNDVAEGTNEITFLISGEPSKTSTSLISIVIPKIYFNGAASTLVDMSVNMKSSAYNITSLSASMPNTTIDGGKGLAMLGTPLVITLDGDGALFNPTSKTNVTFVSPKVEGVDFELQENVAESKSMTIVAKGTPSVTSESVFSILIPRDYIKNGAEDVQVATNNSRYNIVDITASLDSMVTIEGKKGIALSASIPVRVNLKGAKLKGITKAEFTTDLEKFISPVVPGLTYALQSDVASEAESFTIVIGGTPTSQSTDILSIKVPMKYVLNADDSFGDIGVDVKNSKYKITESTAEIVSPLTITGVTNIAKKSQTFDVKLTNEKFIAMTNKEVSWFKDLASGIKFYATATAGSDRATITVSGTPTKVSTAELQGNISASELQNNGGVLASGLPIDTNGSAYNVTELKLKTKEGMQTVSGTSGNVSIDEKTFTVVFDDDLSEELTFKETAESILDTTWINTIVAGLEFKKSAVTAVSNKELVITVSGTPTEDNGSEIRITIPNAKDVITGYNSTTTPNVTVDTAGSRYAISGLYASVANAVTIDGFKDKTITTRELTVNLTNSSFTNALDVGTSVATWFTINGNSNQSGLSYKISKAVKAGDASATIAISGISTIAIPNVSIVMEIPSSYLNGTTQNLRVDTKGSLYNISEVTATSNQQIVSGTQNVSLSEKKFTITLGDNVKFKAISPAITWSNGGNTTNAWMKLVDGLEYVLLANNMSNTAEIVVRGIPTQTINEPISIAIPAYFIDGMRTDAPSISVDTNGSVYAIDTLSANVEVTKKVNGTKNIEIVAQDVTVKLIGSKFKTLASGSDVSSWFTTKVPGLTYKLKGSIPASSSTDTSDTAVITISGTPRSSANATISITIPQTSVVNAQRDVVVDTKEGKFEIADLEAKITTANKQVSGSQNVRISTVTFSVELTGDTDTRPQFIAVSNDTNVKSWFGNSVDGLTYTLKRNTNPSNSLSFEIAGTPTAMSTAVLSITIPKNYVQKYDTSADSSLIIVNTNGAMYNISDLSASLTSTDNNVTGSRNITIATKTLTVKLVGTKFNATSYPDVSSWFGSAVKGLKYVASATAVNSDTLTITISGSPEEVTDQKAMQIVIPTSALTSASKAVIVDTKGAVFDIKAPSASISTAQNISGFRDITLSNTSSFTVNLVNATFVARSNTDVKDWFTPQIAGLNYTLQSTIADGAPSATIKITGTPSDVMSATALSIILPESAIKNATANKFGNLVVDTKGSNYTVEDWSLKSNEVVIKGTDSGVAITKETFTITFDKNNSALTFRSRSALKLDGEWINPLLEGLIFQKLAVTSANNKSLTIEVTGTPKSTTSSPISITIPEAALYITGYNNSSKTSVSVNTSGSRYEITSLYASLTDRTDITGVQYVALPNGGNTLEVNLTQATFKNALAVGTDVSSWFTANHNGLTYKIAEAVSADANSAKVTISGTPEVVLDGVGLSMSIPVSYLNGATGPLSVDTKGSVYTFSPITATSNAVIISGSQGIALSPSPRSITITLSGATFAKHTADVNVASWFSHAVSGLKYNLRPNASSSATAYIDITGTPTETLSEPIVLTIKDNSLINGYSTSAPNIQVDTNGSRHAIASVTARIANAVTVSGTQDISIPANTYKYVINLTNATFNSKTGSVASWVKGAPSGLTYTLESNPSGKSIATVIVAGRPSVTSSATVNFTIPKADIQGAEQDVPVDTLTSTYDIKALSASMPNTTISGSQNTLITARTIRITLANGKFTTLTTSTEDNVRSWFADPLDGLKYTRQINTSQSNYIDITISGTPTSSSNRLIEITIPKTVIVDYDQTKNGIAVNTNSSKYAIGNVTASLASQVVLNATREVSMTNRTMTVNLSGAKFNAVSASAATADISDWFTPTIAGLNYKLLSGITADSISAVITVSGTPTVTSSSAIQMAIPASYIKDANDEVIIDTKSSQYNIVEATASVNTKQTVSGVTNITLKDRDAFTITLTNASFNAVTNISSWFVPQIPGLTYTLSRTVSQGDTSISVKIAGMPTSESSETLGIRIPYTAIKGASSAFGTLNPDGTRSLNVDTKSSVYAISSASATISTAKTITGVKNIAPTTSQSFTITLQAAKFSAINLSNTNGARSWFTNPIDGLTYAISASSNSATATVTISGTPTVSANASIGIVIPKSYLTFDGNVASKDIVVDANGSTYDIKTPSASINSSTALVINGIRNTKISNQTIVVDLTNAEFKNATVANVVSWITPAVNGLSYSFTKNTSTRGTITISGTPTVESSAVISVNIPYTEITNAASSLSSLSVDTKNSHYTIGGTEATVRSALSIKGTKGITLQNTTQSFTIDINGALFKAGQKLTVTSWISNPNNLTFSGITSDDGKYITITPTGVPSSASNATLVITIPTSALQGTVTEAIVVNTKGLEYSIDEVSAIISSRLQVNGILNRQFSSSMSRTVTLTGNDVTLTGLSTSTQFGSSTYVQPLVPGVTYNITSVTAKSFTFSVAGTPTQTSVSTFALTIPRSNIKDANATYFPANVTVNTNDSVYNINEASAKVTQSGSTTEPATVSAIQNVSLETAQLVQINLEAATFATKSANEDVKKWFTNPIDDFSYRLQSALTSSSTVAVVKIEGSPRVQSNERIIVKLPADDISLTKDLTADSNSSVYNITSASASIPNKVEISGSNGATIVAGTYSFDITLKGVKFATVSDLDVSGWFAPTVPGLTYKLTSSIASGAITATIDVSGTPTRSSSSVLALTIPNSALLGATNLGDLTVNTKESAYSIQDVSLTFSKTVEINGFTNVPLQSGANDFTMTLSGAGFAAMGANEDLDDWFTKVDGVHFKTKAAITAGTKTLAVAVSGTPTKGLTSHIYVQQANMKLDTPLITNITMDTKDSVYNIIDVTATFAKRIALSGAKNIPATDTNNTFTINITGIKFASLSANQDVTEWVKPAVAGLSFKVVSATGTASSSVTVKPEGTPTVASENVMWSVVLPARHLQGYTQNLNVDTLSSVYNIIDTTAAISETTHIVGTKEQMISPVTMTINLENGLKFRSMTTTTNLASWFDPNVTVPGLSYNPKVAVTTGATSMQVSITGTPSVTTERLAVKITIPPNTVYYDDNTKFNTQSITVDAKASEYQIAAAVTTTPLSLTVTADIEIEPQEFEIYLRGTELTSLKAGDDITDWFTFEDMEIPVEPPIEGGDSVGEVDPPATN